MSYGVFSYFYDDLMQEVKYDTLESQICSLLTQYGVGGGLLLDLACGTGTVSLALSKAGYDVIGVDFSEDMLMEAQQKATEENENILFLCQDMRNLDLYGTIDAAVCTLDGLNHLACREDVQTVLNKVSLFMNPGGVFLFDVNTLYKHQNVLANNSFIYDMEDVFCAWQNTLSEDGRAVAMDLDFFILGEDGLYERESEHLEERAYAFSEWKAMLQQAGFKILDVFDGYTGQKPTEETERYLFAVRKETI